MGIKVLESDLGAGPANTFLTKNLSGLSAPVYFQCDFWVPSATLAALNAISAFTADFIELDVAIDDGIYARPFGGLPYRVSSYNGTTSTDLVADAWHTLAAHYTGSHIFWKLDGSPLDDYDVTLTLDAINSMGNLGAQIAGEIYYSDNYRVGTTPGGTDIFCSDFEIGDLSEWDSVTGSGSSVVDDPLGSGGPTGPCIPTPPAPFSIAASPSTVTVFIPFFGTLSGDTAITSTLLSGSPEDITLSVLTSLPTGVSAGFSPNPITDDGGVSTLTFTVDPSASPGSHPLTVEGDDGMGGVADTPVTLVLETPPPGFHIAS